MTDARDRLLELLAARALVGLGQREQIELAELLVKVQDVDIAAFDNAASAIDSPARPASDYMKTRELEKLAPGLARTQVDEILEADSIGPASEIEPEEESLDFKKTLALEDRPGERPAVRKAERPGLVTQEPPSIATLVRPNDAYVAKKIDTTPRPFLPTPLVPSPPPPPGYASRAYPPQSSGPVPSAYGRAPSPPPSFPNVVPFPAARAPSRGFAIAGWIAAAACFLLAVGAFALRTTTAPVATLPPGTMPSSTPVAMPTSTASVNASAQLAALTPGELRDKLLAAEGSARAEWTPTKDPLGKAATGEVVWNEDQQKGTMRFRGLAKNDPSRAQYQLWIFDKTRDEKYPVDGGVFDVDSETGDVIVPIHATLAVNAPVMFAVTLEKPGGVVVSKRDRIVVTAKLPAG